MKALLVTCQITYVPRNYQALFDSLFANGARHLGGLVILNVLDLTLLKKIAGLHLLGCSRIASTMIQNIVDLPKRRRETHFEIASLPVIRASSMNEPWIIDWVSQQDIDLVINARTRCIYRTEILKTPRLGCINLHHGILPKYRGTLCDLHALFENRPAGFSIHRMVKKVDGGEILHVEEVSQGEDDDFVAYLDRAAYCEGMALAKLLDYVAENGRLPQGQPNDCDAPVTTKTPKRKKIMRLRKEIKL